MAILPSRDSALWMAAMDPYVILLGAALSILAGWWGGAIVVGKANSEPLEPPRQL
jgi:hypothetical protein